MEIMSKTPIEKNLEDILILDAIFYKINYPQASWIRTAEAVFWLNTPRDLQLKVEAYCKDCTEFIYDKITQTFRQVIWVEMGQLSEFAEVINNKKRLKIGDRITLKLSSDQIEEAICYEWNYFKVQDQQREDLILWSIPTSVWWQD